MKIIADTHAHTLVSGHAYNTLREMASAAANHGMEVFSLTEHAPDMPGTCETIYFSNLKVVPREMYGMQMLLGVELNLLNCSGEVDMKEEDYKNLDIVLASIHTPCFQEEATEDKITQCYVEAMKKPYINIIGHPDDARMPVNYEVLVKTAKETHTLLEVNNSSLNPRAFRVSAAENYKVMLDLCKQYEVPVTTGSDAHMDVDAGVFDRVKQLFEACDFPEELVVTTDFQKLKPYLNRYKSLVTGNL